MSILLEAVQRFIDPPEITNPQLILIVGCLGLLSNVAGLFVLGGHSHSHGSEEHGHEHEHSHAHGDKARAAEEGHATGIANGHTHDTADESGRIVDVLPEAAVANATRSTPDSAKHIKFSQSDETASTSKDSATSGERSASKSSRRHRRRTSSIRGNRLSSFEDMSMHPASFRQEIIAASRPQLDGIPSEDGSGSDEEAIVDADGPMETSPLIKKGANSASKKPSAHEHGQEQSFRPRHNSWHIDHNHNKPQKDGKSPGGHNHGDMGMRAMVLHVIGDFLGNVGVIVSALVIWLTTWSGRFYADPMVSIFITVIILHTTLPLTKASAKILLQATPDSIVVKDIKDDIEDIPGILSCHHIHIWQLSDSQNVASMHIQVEFPFSSEDGSNRYMEVARQARKCLHAHGIHSATIQPEFCEDPTHIHSEVAGLDGPMARKPDDDSCLLGCVEDCEGGGCCTTGNGSRAGDDHDHSEHDGHGHAH